ncbi:uncharacterized protein C8Q71DRAFT_134240 [Rhodofomes roseus]|uniref:Uncharacterized protein n=1 Tax=Rhodofomes roseus TaxID=34475 RepID=A0ABQ8KBR9_9APHY|nr:uncharacterized protein C8Q71DRAFT_134240 [Rhodofomes roseus]KAH9834965.1 hypothetical protein C8Q71DRAFT_134240 [Rhodofomes roseus]
MSRTIAVWHCAGTQDSHNAIPARPASFRAPDTARRGFLCHPAKSPEASHIPPRRRHDTLPFCTACAPNSCAKPYQAARDRFAHRTWRGEVFCATQSSHLKAAMSRLGDVTQHPRSVLHRYSSLVPSSTSPFDTILCTGRGAARRFARNRTPCRHRFARSSRGGCPSQGRNTANSRVRCPSSPRNARHTARTRPSLPCVRSPDAPQEYAGAGTNRGRSVSEPARSTSDG